MEQNIQIFIQKAALDFIWKLFLDSKKFCPYRLSRSGSSLTGKILSADPDTYYYFEPFHKTKFKYPNGSELALGLEFTKVDQNLISNYTNSLFECHPYVIKPIH